MLKLIAALGNPGAQYKDTRHNIAWLLLEELSFYSGIDWQNKFKGLYALHVEAGNRFHFIKPTTYMNLSGTSILEVMQFFKLDLDDVLVIHDDLELDYGVVDFKNGGGLAGHNGLRSIAACLGSRDFKRLRLGIAKPTHGDITPYVLGPFSQEQQVVLPTFLEGAAAALERCLADGFDVVAGEYKKKRLIQG